MLMQQNRCLQVYAAMSTLDNLCRAGSTANIPAVLEVLVRGLEARLPGRPAATAPKCWPRVLPWHPAMILPPQQHLHAEKFCVLAIAGSIRCCPAMSSEQNRQGWHCSLGNHITLLGSSLSAVCTTVQALWRLARSGSAAPDALVIAQLQTRGAQLGVVLALLLVRGSACLPGLFVPSCPVLLQKNRLHAVCCCSLCLFIPTTGTYQPGPKLAPADH